MNTVILMGRLTKDPEIRYSQGDEPQAVARYSLAVDRRGRKDNSGQTADFINCVAFRKSAEFAEKYLQKGMKILVTGRIQTGSYTNKDGQKVYTTDVVVEQQEFCESKSSQGGGNSGSYGQAPQGNYGNYQTPQGSQQYGGQPQGNQGYNNQPQANQQYGNQPQANQQYGNQPQANQQYGGQPQGYQAPNNGNGFMNIPDGIDETLPFN